MDGSFSLSKKFEVVTKVVAWIAGICIFFSMLYVSADIIARIVFKTSIGGGTDQLISMLTVFIAYMPLAYTMSEKGHVTMTVVTDRLKGRKKIICDMWVNFYCTAFFALMFYVTFTSGFLRTFNSKEIVETSFPFRLYLWYGKIAQPIGAGVMTIMCALMFVDSVAELARFNKKGPEPGGGAPNNLPDNVPGQEGE